LQQQANLANQGLMGQYGLQQGQFGQSANQANQQAQMQANLANQSLAGQYGLQQGQFGQAANQANQQTQQQTNLANQALAGQYGMQQGQFGQAANQFNAGNQQQANLANQALAGQYGMQQGQFNQAANQANQASRNQFGMANLANQQTANQANQAAQNQFGMANLANQQQSNLANQGILGQYGMQQGQFNQAANLANQQSRNQANLANQQAQLAAQGQNIGQQQFGANYRMQGLGQAGQLSGQLAGIGGQQLQAQQGILTAQNAVGAQQQQLQQQQINQAIQDYANAQQYPIMQLGTMSNMLRGLPMQAQTTQQYQAQANPITQGIGALGAGASLYNAVKAKGGVVKAAEGGIMSYDVGGSIRAKLEDMPDESLKAQLKSSSSDSIKNDIKQILATRNMAGIKQAAQGGVLRYAEPNEENNQGVTKSKSTSLSPELINSAITMGPDNSGNTFLNSRIAEAKAAEDRAAARAASEQSTKDSVKGFFKNLGDRSAYRRSDSAVPATSVPVSTPTLVKPVVTPETDLTGIKQAGPAGVAPAGTNPAGAPAAVASSDGTGKVSKEKIDQIRKTNPEFNAAMGSNATDKTFDYLKQINKELGISDVPPVDENAGMSTAAILARDTKLREEYAGKNPAFERRKQINDEKANALDEAKRTQAMRMAEFFAMWGSTPGNTIVAGLNAMKNKIPDFIADTKEATKIRRDMDKSIAELDQIDYLEKNGRVDEAEKKRAAATKNAIDTWGIKTTKALTLTGIVAKEAGDVNVAHIKGKYDVQKAGIDRAGQRESIEIAKANEDYRRTQSDINNSRLKTEYVDMMKTAGREITDKTPESARAKITNAQKELAKMEKSFNDNEKRALERLNSTYKKYGYSVDEGKSSGSSNVSTGKLPSLDSDKYKLK
jgi:soluble cytochrome b562